MGTDTSKTNDRVVKNQGREARSPVQIGARGWWQIVKRVNAALMADHIAVVAAGVAFFYFLAIFPALAAVVSIYGLVVSPDQVVAQIGELLTVAPPEIRRVLEDLLKRVAGTPGDTLGLGLVTGLLISLWSAKKGMGGVFEGVNLVYHEVDRRSFLARTGLQLLFTLAGILVLCLSIGLVVVFPAIIEFFYLPDFLTRLLSGLRWLLLGVLAIFALGMIYWKAPARSTPKPRWVTMGAVVATLLWLAGSWVFSFYVGNFGSFDRTYGSFAAIIILMLWLFLTAFSVLLGAEINAQSEYQTARDTTVGERKPMGQRGAYYADHVVSGGDNNPVGQQDRR